MMQFTPATQKQGRLRLALIGPAGSGKTFSALRIAQALGQRIAVIDTERGSASKYASLFAFDVLELETFSPLIYVQAIAAADSAGYEVVIIDSLSHAWSGRGGALELKDAASKRMQNSNDWAAWRDVTPVHNQMVDAILQSRAHVIATIRAKTEYLSEKNSAGKTVIRKVGLAPVQRDGLEYEFDVVGDLDPDHHLLITKSRCPAIAGASIPEPGEAFGQTLREWLSTGVVAPAAPPVFQAAIGSAPLTPEPGGDAVSTPDPAASNAADPPDPEYLKRYRFRLEEGRGLSLELAEFELRESEITQSELIRLGVSLKQKIDAALSERKTKAASVATS